MHRGAWWLILGIAITAQTKNALESLQSYTSDIGTCFERIAIANAKQMVSASWIVNLQSVPTLIHDRSRRRRELLRLAGTMVGAETFRLTLCALALSFVSSCSLVVDPSTDSIGAPPRTCKPNDEAICACIGGVQGVQVCNEGGSFDPCICGGAGNGG